MTKSCQAFYIYLTFFTSSFSFAFEGVGVMVLDCPVDYRHSLIAPVIDTTAMALYSFTANDGRNVNWKELTDQYSRELVRGVHPSLLEKILNHFDHLMDEEKKTESFKAEYSYAPMSEIKLIQQVENRIEKQIDIYLHGTHIAGLAVKGLSSVRLISAPVFSAHGFALQTLFDSGLKSEEYERGKRNLATVSRAISEQEIKVVNMSFNRVWSSSIEESLSEILPLFIEHPDTIFVMSAGNNSIDLSSLKGASGKVFPKSGVQNVLLVAALDEEGELHSSSDFGVGVVDIAAQGGSVVSARSGGGTIHMEGTSVAASVVTRKIVQIYSEHPELNAFQAIRFLLDREPLRNVNLIGKVTEGR
ncbi:MAG: S8/S53 family peptidase, partial [Bdellovibrionia bacterium]